MKQNKTNIIVFIILIVIGALYRVWDNRPLGFAPQIAMALFAGSVIKDKKIAFLFPLLSMLFSDALYQLLYTQGLTSIAGFYKGQWVNYILFACITIIGFKINAAKAGQIFAGSVAGVLFFFIVSNFLDWIGGGLDLNNQPYPKNFDGLMTCYAAGLPFLKGSLIATFVFNAVLFGGYNFAGRWVLKPVKQ
ncbi:MAG: hypothetical protein JST17_11565 [Bacteroidetes bacterium]|nr:hypothetical protein [Bacteroidota bacterium]MBS1930139.1 hypothetical protein [Bacteroidota bacterium]